MKSILPLVCLFTMSSCGGGVVVHPLPPHPIPEALPNLDKELIRRCPGLSIVKSATRTALAAADIESSKLYAKCQKDKSTIVHLYEEAQASIARFIANVTALNKTLNTKQKP